MVLEQQTYPTSNLQTFLNLLVGTLTGAVDYSTIPLPLNTSVTIGLNEALKSATEMRISASECPGIKILTDPYAYSINNTTNLVTYVTVPLQMYFFYSLDFPSPNFVFLRDNHLFRNMQYMRYDYTSSGIGMPPPVSHPWWKWYNNQSGTDEIQPNIQLEHNIQTIQYLGQSIRITPDSDFNCTRLKTTVLIQPWLGTSF